jgi:hypothetical protein
MQMRVVCARPPLFDAIDAAFHIAGKPVIFAFGDTIYNPMGVAIAPSLMAHEAVHGERQRGGDGDVTEWWRRYIDEPQFRLAEEIPAHQAEYRALCAEHPTAPRNQRRLFLSGIARRLASPLYGGIVSFEAARKLVKAAP